MKSILFSTPYFLFIIVFLSCAGRNNSLFIPEPDFSVFATNRTIEIGNIIETKSGVSSEIGPEWLSVFISEGIRATERIETYREKYLFVAVNEGGNFTVLDKWAQNISATHDLAVLVGNRIEERMILNASLYPDDEYGDFFEIFIKNAYNTEYQSAVKEDIYWIRHSQPEIYTFFVLFSVDRNTMVLILRRMMSQANITASPTGSQAASVNRLRQTFFEGF